MKIPNSINRFVKVFSELPGIGPRAAVRLAFYFIYKGEGILEEAKKALDELQKIKICKQCFYINELQDSLCEICRDKTRNHKVIAVLEKETDLLSIENAGKYSGRYFIIGDLRKKESLSPDQKLRLEVVKDWIRGLPDKLADEIILAINPTSVGLLNAKAITEELKPFAKKITRLGIGIPSGGEIEFADEETLGEALSRRI